MKIAIIGVSGVLGLDIMTYMLSRNQEVLGLDHGDIEVSDSATFPNAFGDFKPEIIINTASCNVVDSEKSPHQAYMVNAIGACNVAKYAQEVGSVVVHYSTDYVFDGTKNKYANEEEKPNPINTYGASKLAGEYMVKNNCAKHLVIRTGGVYSKNPSRKGKNFIHDTIDAAQHDTIEVATNYKFSPTWTMQLCKNLTFLLNSEEYGLYHMVATGDGSYYDFAKIIVEELRLKTELVPVEKDLGNVPKYRLLHNKNLEVIGINKMDFWDAALKRFLLNFEAV